MKWDFFQFLWFCQFYLIVIELNVHLPKIYAGIRKKYETGGSKNKTPAVNGAAII